MCDLNSSFDAPKRFHKIRRTDKAPTRANSQYHWSTLKRLFDSSFDGGKVTKNEKYPDMYDFSCTQGYLPTETIFA